MHKGENPTIDSAGRLRNLETKIEDKEGEKKKRVVRVCVTRSRTSAEFNYNFKNTEPRYKDLADLELTSFMLAEKSEVSHNPGQVMPVGGKIAAGESLVKAAASQLLNETHLNPAGPIVDLGRMTYDIPNREEQNTAYFVGTKILPTDRPFSINPEQDKIKRFHYFTLGQFDELLVSGVAKRGSVQVDLLDSLKTPLRQEEMKNEEAAKVNLEVINFGQKEEARKKTDVLRRWFDSDLGLFENCGLLSEVEEWKKVLRGDLLPGANHVEGEIPHPRKEPDLFAVQWVWREVFNHLQEKGINTKDTQAGIFKAIDLSNFAESVKENDGGPSFSSDLEAGLYFVYALLETYHIDKQYLEIAKGSRHIQSVVGGIERFVNFLVPNGDQDIAKQLSDLGNILEEATSPDKKAVTQKVEQAFCRAFHLNPNELVKKLNAIDEFLDGLAQNAIGPSVQGEFSSNKIEQNNEIKRADLVTLLRKAFPSEAEAWKERYRSPNDTNKNSLKSVVFEARRKLVLLAILSPAEEYYRGKEIISDSVEGIYSQFISGPNYDCSLKKVVDKNGALNDIVVGLAEEKKYVPNFAFDEYEPESHSALRKMSTDGGKYFVDINKPLPKTWESFARKMLVRGFDNPELIMDIFRRSITLAAVDNAGLTQEHAEENNKKLYTREKRSIGNVFFENEQGKEEPLREVEDVSAILDIVEQFAKQPGVRVIDYKSTPVGGKLKSDSPGGGSDVRFAKFYLEHTTPNGDVHYEEVQVYSPGDNGHPSAFYYKTKKEEDDKKYFLKRLLRTKGRHSVIDVLFPVGIYGLPIFEAKKRLEQSAKQINLFDKQK